MITNKHDIDLPLALWLLQNDYDNGNNDTDRPKGELISVTTLLKPTRDLILRRKVDESTTSRDVSTMAASSIGNAIHDALESMWYKDNWKYNLKLLGFDQAFIDSIVINPKYAVTSEMRPIYVEQRYFKKVDKFNIVVSGKLDLVQFGKYKDYKTTGTYAYNKKDKEDDFIKQASIYRWLNPEVITEEEFDICFIFKDWMKNRASDPNYPPASVVNKTYKLMSLEDTEKWIINKIQEIVDNAKLDQKDMIRCNNQELWIGEPFYKYYLNEANIATAKKSTKTSSSYQEITAYKMSKGNKGKIITVHPEPKACFYCPSNTVCDQAKEYFPDGFSD